MAPSQRTEFFSLKLVLLGESGVGKTSLALRFVQQEFHPFPEPTIGASFLSRSVELPRDTNDNTSRRVTLRVWDTAGQERYQSLTPLYFRGANAAILVYDRTKWHTWESLKRWVRDFRQYGNQDAILIICGNKCDLLEHTEGQAGVSVEDQERTDEREAQQQPDFLKDIHEYARRIGATYMETSAKDGTNINEMFQLVAELASEKDLLAAEEGTGGVDLSSPPTNRNCCTS